MSLRPAMNPRVGDDVGVYANPVPTQAQPGSATATLWTADFREVRSAWLTAAPDDIAEAYTASLDADSRVIAEQEAADAGAERVTAWGRDVCGLDGL